MNEITTIVKNIMITKNKYLKSIRLLILLIFSSKAIIIAQEEKSKIGVNFSMGCVYNIPTPLHIEQSGYPDINFTAKYKTYPFDLPLYLSTKLSIWKNNKAWEAEILHHKIYLINPPDEIQLFSISHGFNILTINRNWKYDKSVFCCGLGVVIAHPENIIRNKQLSFENGIFNWGAYFSGPVANISITQRFYIVHKLFFNL